MEPGRLGGAVLAGGQSRRFGSNKAVANVGGAPLGAVAVEALRSAGVDPVIAIGGTSDAAAQMGLVLVGDQFPSEGPLGGTATALSYFTTSHVVVCACDLPLVKADDVLALCASLEQGIANVSAVGGEPQLSLACWPTAMYRNVLSSLRAGKRRWDTLLELTPYNLVEVPSEAVADADDPQTLSHLLRLQDPE
jgi:molybdopterin-guanine dinucleotide biosynthesis protein A